MPHTIAPSHQPPSSSAATSAKPSTNWPGRGRTPQRHRHQLSSAQLSSENEADISFDYVSVRSTAETLRPAQDLEGPLGTMRETLHKIEADLIVLEEKRYNDAVGDYGVASISGIIVDVLC